MYPSFLIFMAKGNCIFSKKQLDTVDFILCSGGFQGRRGRVPGRGCGRDTKVQKGSCLPAAQRQFLQPVSDEWELRLPLKTFFGGPFCSLNNHY